jgi:hypothetical protein
LAFGKKLREWLKGYNWFFSLKDRGKEPSKQEQDDDERNKGKGL